MPSRIFKQTIIALIFLVILALIVLGLYFLFFKKGSPQEENGKIILQDIEILEIAAIQTKEGYYDLVVKIKNPNSNYGASSVLYQFELYGLNQEVTEIKEGQTFILPAETKYLVETKIAAAKPVGSSKLIIKEVKWKKFKEFQPELFIYDKKFQLIEEHGVYAQASGILYNASPFDLEEIKVNIVLKNEDRKIIASNSHKIFTLGSGQERYFAARWFTPIKEQVFFLEIEPEFNVFIDDNFIRRYGILEKFQEF